MNNLLVLARENAGASLIWTSGGVPKILEVVREECSPGSQQEELAVAAQRVLDELARDEQRVLN